MVLFFCMIVYLFVHLFVCLFIYYLFILFIQSFVYLLCLSIFISIKYKVVCNFWKTSAQLWETLFTLLPLRFWAWASSTEIDKIGRVLAPSSLDQAENWLNYQEKASFLVIFTKSVELIFQSAVSLLRHTAIEGTLVGNQIKLRFKQAISMVCTISSWKWPKCNLGVVHACWYISFERVCICKWD